MIMITWDQFKNIFDTSKCYFTSINLGNYYYILCKDTMLYCHVAITDPANEEQTEYENNYYQFANKNIYDNSGRSLARIAIAESGNGISCHAFEVETSKLGSFFSKIDDNSTDCEGFTFKLYKDDSSEITQESDEQYCVLTEVIFEPTYDYEAIGGTIHHMAKPTSAVRVYLTAIPDVPAYTKYMCKGGLDMRYMEASEHFVLDGRAPKLLQYDENYHTNKLRFRFYTEPGYNHKLCIRIEYYK